MPQYVQILASVTRVSEVTVEVQLVEPGTGVVIVGMPALEMMPGPVPPQAMEIVESGFRLTYPSVFGTEQRFVLRFPSDQVRNRFGGQLGVIDVTLVDENPPPGGPWIWGIGERLTEDSFMLILEVGSAPLSVQSVPSMIMNPGNVTTKAVIVNGDGIQVQMNNSVLTGSTIELEADSEAIRDGSGALMVAQSLVVPVPAQGGLLAWSYLVGVGTDTIELATSSVRSPLMDVGGFDIQSDEPGSVVVSVTVFGLNIIVEWDRVQPAGTVLRTLDDQWGIRDQAGNGIQAGTTVLP